MDERSGAAIVVSLLLTVGPYLVAVAALRRRDLRVRLLVGVVVAAALTAVPLLVTGPPVFDLLGAGSAFLLGALVAPRGGAVLFSLALFVGVAEGAARTALPPAPEINEIGPWRPWSTFVEVRRSTEACSLAYPDTHDPRGHYGLTPADVTADRVVLHVGDSMLVFGPGERRTPRDPRQAVSLLDAADPQRAHVNLGVPGTGPDMQWAIAEAWRARLPVEAVVAYILPVNDLEDLSRAYPCCPGGPILEEDGATVRRRCEVPASQVPRQPTTPSGRWRAASAPLAVRAATRHSRLAGHLRARLVGGGAFFVPWSAESGRYEPQLPASRWAYLQAVLEAWKQLDASGTDVTVVVLGRREAGFAGAFAAGIDARRDRILALCHEVGLDCVDAQPAYGEAPATWFLEDGWHFAAPGHAALAGVVAEALGLDLTPPSPPRAAPTP